MLAACALVMLAAQAAAGRAVTPADAALRRSPEPPRFPDSYQVNYTFILPYTQQLQPHGFRYPVAFYKDAANKRVRMDTYDSTNVLIANKGRIVELVPRIERHKCLVMEDDPGAEPAARMTALPDVSGWDFAGPQQLEGEDVDVWEYTATHEAKHVIYRLYVTADGVPRRFYMHGRNILAGAHFDEWIADYTAYTPGPPEPSVFDTPELCAGVRPSALSSAPAGLLRMAAVAPAVHYAGGDSAYDSFLGGPHGVGRRHSSLGEYRLRADLYRSNLDMIESHNAAGKSYKMAMNKYGDWTRDEFMALMLPRHGRQQALQEQGYEGGDGAAADGSHSESKAFQLDYEPLADPSKLPAELSWQGTGADSTGVKDQACCGSCWAFGASGAMAGAWWRATGQRVSFSEQQIMDCSWGFDPKSLYSTQACDGGDAWAAIGYVAGAGGISLTDAYEYLGQDGFCRADTTQKTGKFKGWARVPRFNDTLTKEALFSRGPLAVSMDASQPGFAFYSSGVFYEQACMWKPKDLDHVMLLMGYGTGPEGDYWLVKNSWSSYWGDSGFIKVAREHHACGATSDAVYAVVDDSSI